MIFYQLVNRVSISFLFKKWNNLKPQILYVYSTIVYFVWLQNE